MHPIRLNHATGVPVFQQIVEQITYMIETGQLDDGDQLPSSRMLADNLHVNRNTVARAYGELGRRGLVSSQGRRGMVVRDAGTARARMAARESAHSVLAAAVARCLELGLPPEEIASLAYQQSLHAKRSEVRLAFVECNRERADALSADLAEAIDAPIRPLVLEEIVPGDVLGSDLVVTTFYHLAEVRQAVRELAPDAPPEVLGIVIGPHVRTLARLSQIPRGERIGIYYTTEEQAEGIRRSLADTGFDKVDVISGPGDPAIARCAVVIVPSEAPELGEQVRGAAPIVEYGNVLDAGSIRMVSDLVDEVRERKGHLVGNGARS